MEHAANKWLAIGVTPPELVAKLKAQDAAIRSNSIGKNAENERSPFRKLLAIEKAFGFNEFSTVDLIDRVGGSNNYWRNFWYELNTKVILCDESRRRNTAIKGASGKVIYRKLKPNWKELYHERL